MEGVSFLDDLKIRGGWGQMGNSNNVNPNNQYSLYSSSIDNAAYDINGTNTSAAEGFYKSRIGNPDAKWETSTTTNIGFDALLLDGKLDVIVDLWKKKPKTCCFRCHCLTYSVTTLLLPAVNIASMLNQGIDVQLTNKGHFTDNIKYELTLTGAWLKNEITSLAPGVDYFDVTPANQPSERYRYPQPGRLLHLCILRLPGM